MSIITELKRRKVFHVAGVYAVVAWLLVQIITAIEEPLSLPDWTDTFVIVCLAIGFPITLIISWAFNLTSEGLVRDHGEDVFRIGDWKIVPERLVIERNGTENHIKPKSMAVLVFLAEAGGKVVSLSLIHI